MRLPPISPARSAAGEAPSKDRLLGPFAQQKGTRRNAPPVRKIERRGAPSQRHRRSLATSPQCEEDPHQGGRTPGGGYQHTRVVCQGVWGTVLTGPRSRRRRASQCERAPEEEARLGACGRHARSSGRPAINAWCAGATRGKPGDTGKIDLLQEYCRKSGRRQT